MAPLTLTLTISSLGAPDLHVDVPAGASVSDVAAAVAKATLFPLDRLRLIHASTSLPLIGTTGPAPVADGDTLLAVAVPRAPPPSALGRVVTGPSAGTRRRGGDVGGGGGDGGDDDDDDDNHLIRVRLDPATRPLAAHAGRALLRAGAPEAFVAVLLHPRALRFLAWLGVWAAGAKFASALGCGPPYLVLSLPLAIYCNLGRRRPGEASGYAIFNRGFRELPGTLNARGMDEALRRGQM